ncbi:uncharacterized protein J3R85_017521 [Psidium guajava]|nr:uncharacterized protein J3R85_017521 [Psidium guajava]
MRLSLSDCIFFCVFLFVKAFTWSDAFVSRFSDFLELCFWQGSGRFRSTGMWFFSPENFEFLLPFPDVRLGLARR